MKVIPARTAESMRCPPPLCTDHKRREGYLLSTTEEPAEQCTVVFAYIVTEPGGWGVSIPSPPSPPFHTPHSLAGSITINAKTTTDYSPEVPLCPHLTPTTCPLSHFYFSFSIVFLFVQQNLSEKKENITEKG
jgi:hypothetical protein